MTHSVLMPDLGQTTAEGKVLRWLKKPGDKVIKGEPLLEVETDKVTMEVEAYRGGYLREILVTEGQMAGAASPIALLTDDPAEVCQRLDVPGGSAAEEPPVAGRPSSLGKRVAVPGGLAASPAARSRARELGVDLMQVVGTGPEGLITRRDVESLGAPGATLKPLPPMAAITLSSVQTIPHFYVTVDVDVSRALQWRVNWNASHPDLHASANDIFVRAASKALQDVPQLNVRLRDGKVQQVDTADVLLVVAGERQLTLVPISSPAGLGWEEYLRRMNETLDRARQNRLTAPPSTPCLAISNLGMFGVKQFTAIIPPTSTAVLAIGAIRKVPIVKNKQLEIGEVCGLTLSADHRLVEGITAAKFLERVQVQLNSL